MLRRWPTFKECVEKFSTEWRIHNSSKWQIVRVRFIKTVADRNVTPALKFAQSLLAQNFCLNLKRPFDFQMDIWIKFQIWVTEMFASYEVLVRCCAQRCHIFLLSHIYRNLYSTSTSCLGLSFYRVLSLPVKW